MIKTHLYTVLFRFCFSCVVPCCYRDCSWDKIYTGKKMRLFRLYHCLIYLTLCATSTIFAITVNSVSMVQRSAVIQICCVPKCHRGPQNWLFSAGLSFHWLHWPKHKYCQVAAKSVSSLWISVCQIVVIIHAFISCFCSKRALHAFSSLGFACQEISEICVWQLNNLIMVALQK